MSKRLIPPSLDIGGRARSSRLGPTRTYKRVVLGFLVVWLMFQVLFPLRHFLYPGNPSWTEEGHKFAWQMKLRSKKARAIFSVRDPVTNQEWQVLPLDFLLHHQARKMAARPDMILQFAHYLARVWREEQQIEGVEVRARVCASLNGRPGALLIDPNRDLAQVEQTLSHADWILPLKHPFERPKRRQGRKSRELTC